ncbi:MAG: DUF3570 domain-containing protein [Bacteroidota bacterium]|nr:DUF3570 domain-containing protein [Bacteroidota bacterium]
MKKICLTVVGLFFMLLSAFSQRYDVDTTSYKSQTLSLEEADMVSGYYNQTGDHSAVTGGIGTQKLNDVSNIIDLKFSKFDAATNKYSLSFEFGADHHTSASQAYVSKSGASRPGGTRIYPSANWEVEKANGFNFGFGAGFSTEYNYKSFNLNFSAGKVSKDKNTEINLKAQAFFDAVTLIEPSELIPNVVQNSASTYTTASGNVVNSGESDHKIHIPTTARNTFDASLTLSQVVTKNFQFALITDVVAQNGYLGLPFHRVYFQEQDPPRVEKLPDTRFKLPIGVRLNYFLGDKIILRSYYRYYTDSWGIKSHTASLEVPYKISPFVSVSPFYRYYVQTAAKYFAPYKEHVLTDNYYTSNYDLSGFTSQYFGVNLKITPKNGVFNMPFFNTVELRYGRYTQTTGLMANNIAIDLKFK